MIGPEESKDALAEATQQEFAGMNRDLQRKLNHIMASFADCTEDQSIEPEP